MTIANLAFSGFLLLFIFGCFARALIVLCQWLHYSIRRKNLSRIADLEEYVRGNHLVIVTVFGLWASIATMVLTLLNGLYYLFGMAIGWIIVFFIANIFFKILLMNSMKELTRLKGISGN